jgi:hypothetical protein
MKLLTLSLLLFISLTGCGVSAFKPQNWNNSDPYDIYRTKNLDICRRLAQQEELKPSVDDYQSIIKRSTNQYDNYKKPILISCMQNKGYKLRELTNGELFINVITAPIVFPILISGRSFDDTY